MATDVVHELVIRGTMPKSGREGRIGTSLHVRNTLSVDKGQSGRAQIALSGFHFTPISGVFGEIAIKAASPMWVWPRPLSGSLIPS